VQNVQVFVEKDAVETGFAKWAQPGHFSRTIRKVQKQQLGFGIYMLMYMILTVKLVF
jgi:hypothetical protein